MLAPVRTVAPDAGDPIVTWDQAEKHLRLDGDTSEQAMVEALVAAATQHLDGWSGILGRALVTQTWRQDFDGFRYCLRLPLAPVQSIETVTYYDGDNAQQTLGSDVYELRTDELGPYVGLKPDQSWPGVYGRIDAVSVTFVAGYGAASAVPQAIKQAILLMVGSWFEGREETVIGVSVGSLPTSVAVTSLLAPYRRIGF